MAPDLPWTTGMGTINLIRSPWTVPQTIANCTPGHTVVSWTFEIDIFANKVLTEQCGTF